MEKNQKNNKRRATFVPDSRVHLSLRPKPGFKYWFPKLEYGLSFGIKPQSDNEFGRISLHIRHI